MAGLLGLNTALYGSYENGNAKASLNRIASWARILGGVPFEVADDIPSELLDDPDAGYYDAGAKAYAEWLRSARMNRGLTQKETADAAGVPLRTLMRLEKGTEKPDRSSALKIAHFFGTLPKEIAAMNGFKLPYTSGRRRITPAADLSPFGRIIRSIREAQCLSQQAFAEKMDCMGLNSVREIELGRRPVTETFLKTMADRFNFGIVPMFWREAATASNLRLGSKAPHIPDPDGAGNLSPLGRVLAEQRREHIGTRGEFAERIGISSDEVREIEFGNRTVGMKTLEDWAKLCGLPTVPKNWLALRMQSRQVPDEEPRPTLIGVSTFGRIFTAERKRTGISRREAADVMGIRPYTVEAVERKGCLPEPVQIVRISRRFGHKRVPEEWLAALDEAERNDSTRRFVKKTPLRILIRILEREDSR